MPLIMVDSWSMYFFMTASLNWTTIVPRESETASALVPMYGSSVVDSKSRNHIRE